jgi:hypothetical protein
VPHFFFVSLLIIKPSRWPNDTGICGFFTDGQTEKKVPLSMGTDVEKSKEASFPLATSPPVNFIRKGNHKYKAEGNSAAASCKEGGGGHSGQGLKLGSYNEGRKEVKEGGRKEERRKRRNTGPVMKERMKVGLQVEARNQCSNSRKEGT